MNGSACNDEECEAMFEKVEGKKGGKRERYEDAKQLHCEAERRREGTHIPNIWHVSCKEASVFSILYKQLSGKQAQTQEDSFTSYFQLVLYIH